MRTVANLTLLLAALWLVLAASAPSLLRWQMTTALTEYGSSPAQIDALIAEEQRSQLPRVLFGLAVGAAALVSGLLIQNRHRPGLWALYVCVALAAAGALLPLLSANPPSIVTAVLSLALWLPLGRFAYERNRSHGHTWWRGAA